MAFLLFFKATSFQVASKYNHFLSKLTRFSKFAHKSGFNRLVKKKKMSTLHALVYSFMMFPLHAVVIPHRLTVKAQANFKTD